MYHDMEYEPKEVGRKVATWTAVIAIALWYTTMYAMGEHTVLVDWILSEV